MIRLVSTALPVVAALFACAPHLSAQDSPASVDSLVAKIGEIRKQRAALDKAEAELRSSLKAELKRIADLVEKLGDDVKPPVPKPPEPLPVDPLAAKVRDAIKASAGDDATKRKQCLDLAALYRAAAKLTPDAAQLPDADSLLKRLREASAQMLSDPDALREVRKVVAGELVAVLPTVADAPLTAEHRAAAVKVFERLAAVLEEAGK